MTFLQRLTRKGQHLYRRYFLDGLIAEWLAPVLLPWVFPKPRRSIPKPETVRAVLVWNVDSFGDFLFITPLLTAVKTLYPTARIDLVINEACRPLAETNPHIHRLITVRAKKYYHGDGLFEVPAGLREVQYDVGIIAEMGSRPADCARVVMRRLAVSYIVSSHCGILKTLTDYCLPPNQSEYWPSYFLKLAHHLGLVSLPSPQPQVFLTAHDHSAANSCMTSLSCAGSIIAMHPMVASYALTTKKWPDLYFTQLAVLVDQFQKARFVITGSREESPACELLASTLRKHGLQAISVAGQLSLRGTVALFQQVDLLITGDTAALHLGAAAGVPTVALFGATDEKRLSTPEMAVLTHNLPCRPCHKLTDRNPQWPTCHYGRPWCLERITPEQVAERVRLYLSRPKGEP